MGLYLGLKTTEDVEQRIKENVLLELKNITTKTTMYIIVYIFYIFQHIWGKVKLKRRIKTF